MTLTHAFQWYYIYGKKFPAQQARNLLLLGIIKRRFDRRKIYKVFQHCTSQRCERNAVQFVRRNSKGVSPFLVKIWREKKVCTAPLMFPGIYKNHYSTPFSSFARSHIRALCTTSKSS